MYITMCHKIESTSHHHPPPPIGGDVLGDVKHRANGKGKDHE